jgi:hypothetical protein
MGGEYSEGGGCRCSVGGAVGVGVERLQDRARYLP